MYILYTYLLTYLRNMDIDMATFSQYHIDIGSKSEKWYRSITGAEQVLYLFVCLVCHNLYQAECVSVQKQLKNYLSEMDAYLY